MIASFFGRNRTQLPLPPLDPPPSSEKRLEKEKAWLASVSKSTGKRDKPSPSSSKYGSPLENVVKSPEQNNGLLSPERKSGYGARSRQSTGGSTKSSTSGSPVASTSSSRLGLGGLFSGGNSNHSSSRLDKGKQAALQEAPSPLSSNFVHIPLQSPSSHLAQAGPAFPFNASPASCSSSTPTLGSNATTDDKTKTLALRLEELEIANRNGLLTDEEYRVLKRNLFERTVNGRHEPPPMPSVEEWKGRRLEVPSEKTGQLLQLSRLALPLKRK